MNLGQFEKIHTTFTASPESQRRRRRRREESEQENEKKAEKIQRTYFSLGSPEFQTLTRSSPSLFTSLLDIACRLLLLYT